MTAVEVAPSGPVAGALAAPTSKSITNRVLVAAALAEGTSVVRDPLASDDSDVMRQAIAAFGATVVGQAGAWQVTGTGGRLTSPERPVSAGLSGTTMRFAAGLAALAPSGATITGAPPLLRRPVGPLVTALGRLGAELRDAAGYPPVVALGGGLAGGTVEVDSTGSSQFASGVLLVAPYARTDVTVAVQGATANGYIDLTADVMRDWGAEVEREDRSRWRVTAGRGYVAGDHRIEYDASAAAHLFAMAAATGGTMTVRNATPGSRQPDAALTDVLDAMGCAVRRSGDALTLTGPQALAPIDVDLGAMPDQVTTVAVLAALAEGITTITGVGVTRGHETDRLTALAKELGRVGVRVVEHPDGLVVHGGTVAGPARLATHDDHRLAMAFAALAARVPGIVIEDAQCVAKTYPAFWADLRGLGVDWRER